MSVPTKAIKDPETGQSVHVPLTPSELADFLKQDPVYVPQVITRRQRNLWLGYDRVQAIRAHILTIQDPAVRHEYTVFFNDAETTERKHPKTLALAAALGITTDAELDQAFIDAAKL